MGAGPVLKREAGWITLDPGLPTCPRTPPPDAAQCNVSAPHFQPDIDSLRRRVSQPASSTSRPGRAIRIGRAYAGEDGQRRRRGRAAKQNEFGCRASVEGAKPRIGNVGDGL